MTCARQWSPRATCSGQWRTFIAEQPRCAARHRRAARILRRAVAPWPSPVPHAVRARGCGQSTTARRRRLTRRSAPAVSWAIPAAWCEDRSARPRPARAQRAARRGALSRGAPHATHRRPRSRLAWHGGLSDRSPRGVPRRPAARILRGRRCPVAPVKIAVLGGGYGAKRPLPVLAGLDEFEPVATGRRVPERARELAQEARSRSSARATSTSCSSHPGLQAVHVATPVATRTPSRDRRCHPGQHVILRQADGDETSCEAQAVAAAIEEAGVVGAVNYGRRFQATRARAPLSASPRSAAPPRMVVGLARLRRLCRAALASVHLGAGRPRRGGRMQGHGGTTSTCSSPPSARSSSSRLATTVIVAVREAPDGTATRGHRRGRRRRSSSASAAAASRTSASPPTARDNRGDVIEVDGADGTVILDADKRLHSGRTGQPLETEGPLSPTGARLRPRRAQLPCRHRDGARARARSLRGPACPGAVPRRAARRR